MVTTLNHDEEEPRKPWDDPKHDVLQDLNRYANPGASLPPNDVSVECSFRNHSLCVDKSCVCWCH